MNKVNVAIIVLNWEKPEDTISCVKSVLKNSYPYFHIFLIDNGSSDNSYEKLFAVFGKNKKITLLRNSQNFGYAGGNNFAVDKTEGKFKYLCFLNNDTLVDKKFLEYLLEKNVQLGEKNIYFPLILFWKSNIIQNAGLTDFLPTIFQFKFKNKTADMYFNSIEPSKYLGGVCFLISYTVFQKIGGFNENYFMYSEDSEFGIRAKYFGVNFFLASKAKIWHKGSSGFSPLSLYYSSRNNAYLIKEHSGKKIFDYFRMFLGYSAIFFYNLALLKPKNSWAILQGLNAFLKKEIGKSNIVFT